MGKLPQSTTKLLTMVSLCVALAIASGCTQEAAEPVGTLSGVVYSDDKPVADCRVKIFNKQTLKSAMMIVGEDAKYEFKDILVGEYAMAVVPAPWYEATEPPADNRIPKKYRDVKKSDFLTTVVEGENEFDLEMKK